MFVRKGGKFKIVFFKETGLLLWRKSTLLLAREVLILHLKFCTTYDVLCNFDSYWDHNFHSYLDIHIPSFMLMSDEGLDGHYNNSHHSE